MQKILGILFYLFCGLLLGSFLCLVVSGSVFLEMMVHTRHIFLASMVLILVYGIFKRLAINWNIFVALQILLLLAVLWLGKTSVIYYNLRDFYLGSLGFELIKYSFLAILTYCDVFVVHSLLFNKDKC